MYRCPKCERKRRTGERLKRIKGRLYWITYCAVCGAEITLEPKDKDED